MDLWTTQRSVAHKLHNANSSSKRKRTNDVLSKPDKSECYRQPAPRSASAATSYALFHEVIRRKAQHPRRRRRLPANFHPRAYFLEILPMTLLLHAAIFSFGLLSIGNRGVANRDDGKKSAAKQQRSSTHRFLHSWERRLVSANLPSSRRPASAAGGQRDADRGLSLTLQASVLPGAAQGFVSGRQCPGSVRFPITKFTLIPQFLQRQYAVAVRLTVCKFPFVVSAGPGLRTLAGLTAIAPLAFVGLDGHAALRPLHGPAALRAAVCTGTRPGYRFLQLRIRIPHLTAGFVGDPFPGASRRRCDDQAGRQRRCCAIPRTSGVIKTMPSWPHLHLVRSSGTTMPLSNSSRTSMKRSRILPSASMTQVIGTPFGVPKPSSVISRDRAVG